MTSPDTDVIVGFAQYLADGGVGVYRTDGSAYQDGEVAIIEDTERMIDNAQIILNWVALDDEVEITQGTGILQVAIKGIANDPRSTRDLGWAVFDRLQNAASVVLGSAELVQCYRQSSVPMGQDENRRTERADQYRCDVEYPTTSHRP